jgi:hypothetical protein
MCCVAYTLTLDTFNHLQHVLAKLCYRCFSVQYPVTVVFPLHGLLRIARPGEATIK